MIGKARVVKVVQRLVHFIMPALSRDNDITDKNGKKKNFKDVFSKADISRAREQYCRYCSFSASISKHSNPVSSKPTSYINKPKTTA